MSSQMEMLSEQFNNLLSQYQETYQEFINAVTSNTDGSNNLTTIPNSAFIGQNTVTTIQNSSVDNCLSSCGSNSSCSGATFNEQLNTCTLSSGNGTISASTSETAIVQQALYYSNQLQNLNQQLLTINTQMANISNNDMNKYSTNSQNVSKKAEILNNNYQVLEKERIQIDEMIRQYDTLNASLQNGTINVTSNYYSYMLLLLVAIFLIYVLLKYSTNYEQRGGAQHLKMSGKLMFMFCLLGAIIIFNSIIKK
jgi:hypothetical protein